MTTPEDFKKNVLKVWNHYDTILPKGSHMVVLGLANGTLLFNTLHDKLCPFYVPYPYFYNFLNCTHHSPCATYFSSDPEVRLATA